MKSKIIPVLVTTAVLCIVGVNTAISNSMYPDSMICSNEAPAENCVDQETMDHAVKITTFANRLEAEGGYNPNYSAEELAHEPTPVEIAFMEKYPTPTYEQNDAFWMSRVSKCDSLDNYEDWRECWWRPWLYGF